MATIAWRRNAKPSPAHDREPSPEVCFVVVEGDDDFVDEEAEEGEVVQRPGRPRALNRNARAPPSVRDDDHIAKLKLTVPPFDGRYNPDAYLTW